MAAFKVPRYVLVWESPLPMTTTGKVQKHVLKTMAAKRLGLVNDNV